MAQQPRYICIHGHFYQPPRENAWLEAIELQDSAYPYHDWNGRVTAECYTPNGASRILDRQGRIAGIVSNYDRISYNFGPTLLQWLAPNAPVTYQAVLDADRESRERFSGHGNALAQCYNHMIMPLANERDRRTQVLWGIRDFEHRFGRRPEGIWLPETAVDLDTLEALAEQGIAFTVLEPGQARRVRPLAEPGGGGGGGGDSAAQAPLGAEEMTAGPARASGNPAPGGSPVAQGADSAVATAVEPETWRDVSGGRIDPTRAYLQRLPSGREIALFFYDGPISRAVAFERLLTNGERFANRLLGVFNDARDWPQLVNIATDGETYGHHHRHGDMALAFALESIDARDDVELTNYGEYLERHPPEWEVEIHEDTSWSCAHGVERWRSDCGCHTGGLAGWNQAWRGPLRDALDWLRDDVAPKYEAAGAELFRDPWAARDAYVDVVLDRSPENRAAFFAAHATRELDEAGRVRALHLLEVQRHAMLMYTSCGWFFNELSGIETVQVLQYAGRVCQLVQKLFDQDVETPFLERLAAARSNIPEQGDGREIYERYVRAAMVDLKKVGAHYAVLSLFEAPHEADQVYCYGIDLQTHEERQAGRAHLEIGRARVISDITCACTEVSYAAVHLGDHNVYGGVREFLGEAQYVELRDELLAAFKKADFPAVIRCIDRHFPEDTYSVATLFRDEQRRILDRIMEASLEETERLYKRVYDDRAPLMRFIAGLGMPQPRPFKLAADFVLNAKLRDHFERDYVDLDEVHLTLDEARMSGVDLDAAGLGFALTATLTRLARELVDEPMSLPLLRKLEALAELDASLPWEVDLLEPQNLLYGIRVGVLPQMRERAAAGDAEAGEWVRHFEALAGRVRLAVPA